MCVYSSDDFHYLSQARIITLWIIDNHILVITFDTLVERSSNEPGQLHNTRENARMMITIFMNHVLFYPVNEYGSSECHLQFK